MSKIIVAALLLLVAAQVAISYGHTEISSAIYSILQVGKGVAVEVLRALANWLNGL